MLIPVALDLGMNYAPVEVPCADSVACSSVQHRSGGIEGDLVDLVLALSCSYSAIVCTSTGIAWDHLTRWPKDGRVEIFMLNIKTRCIQMLWLNAHFIHWKDTHVNVRTHLAESRMSQTLIYKVETVKTRPESLQYLTDTTLLGCPLRVTISCPVTKFHILQVRSEFQVLHFYLWCSMPVK